VIGREAEAALVGSLVEGLPRGRPFVLTVRGEEGSGRSCLLDAAREVATGRGIRPLAARGIAGTADPMFAALAGLLRPLAADLDPLAGDLAPAVRGAMALGRGVVDPVDVHLGLLRTLTAAAEAEPVLLLLDDADHLDEASASALAFVLGHLGVDQVGAVVTTGVRDSPFDAVTTEVLPLPPLTPAVLAQIVADALPCTPEVASTVAGWADGSPLVAIELARSLSADQRSGAAPLPTAPRTTVRVVDRLQRELDALPPEVQRALVVIAADRTGLLAPIEAALTTLGETEGGIDRAERAGVVVVDGETVRFRHSLLRPLAYRLVAAASRRAAHRALAASLTAPSQAAERAWQLVASCASPDEEVAATLELVARSEERRGAVSLAARALEHAARLSIDGPTRARRLVAAARAHLEDRDLDAAHRVASDAAVAGDPEAARVLADIDARRNGSGPVDALAAVLSAAELRVAEAVASGLTNRQAADQLFLSAKTVDFHLQSIYRKLSIRSRTELATRVATRSTIS
jgi:DNA-binding CsgD family transcriptional regulator